MTTRPSLALSLLALTVACGEKEHSVYTERSNPLVKFDSAQLFTAR